MDNEPIYSNKFHLSYCRFLERQFGRKVLDEVLNEVGVDSVTFSDINGFQPADVLVKLRAAAKRVTGREDIAYLAGRSMPENLGIMTGFLVGITSPDLVMKLLGKLEGSMALKTITEVSPLGGRKYRVETRFRDGFKEAPEACQNRIGAYESVPRFFSLPYARVEHTECAFKGSPRCVYQVTMPESGFIILKKFTLIGLLAFGVCLAFFLSTRSIMWEALSGAFFSIGLLSYAAYKHLNVRRSLEWNAYINEGLSEQNRNLEETNAEIHSLQDLTLSLSKSIKVDGICNQVVRTLVEDFRYGSSQIWLLDDERKWLTCRSAQGYSAETLALIKNFRFEMGLGWDNPYGLLVQTLEQRKTLLVNEVDEALEKLSERTQVFIRALNPSSFIITPLFDHDTPVGILSAENHGGRKLDQKDRLLFQSISNIIANALVKAELFEGMEQKIQLRTRELEATTQQLISAREMAIQSEKLSSLGQMAAGVAHEINNPLNFLVNIIPDVRRDVEALEKIRSIFLKQNTDPEALRLVREVEEQYDLESHLSEKDFVFERIRKALEKSTRIANSLKVFSRSSSKEKVAPEKFAGMMKEVIELLPQKNKGDTRIDLDIPGDLIWPVNKNEMEQAFLALINNAIDAMGQKGRLEIKAEAHPSEIVLSFKDEGPGIPEELLKRIFDPFYTTKPPGKGTGLGLTIAAEIVKKYGGVLSVESSPGKGTVFLIRFRK